MCPGLIYKWCIESQQIITYILHTRKSKFQEKIEDRLPRMYKRIARQPWDPITCDGISPFDCGICSLNSRSWEGESEGELRDWNSDFLHSACYHGLLFLFFPIPIRLFG